MIGPNNHSTSVLIVGAGPTGLTAAAILAKLGIGLRIIDKNRERSDKSKAIAVQAGTLECLDHAFDPRLSQKLIAAGFPARSTTFHIDDKDPIAIDLTTIPSRYNYILVIPQSETERILEEHLNSLGVQVERGVELTGLLDGTDDVSATLLGPTGIEEICRAKFVVGCDGAHAFLSERGLIAAFPLDGKHRYRLILVPKNSKSANEIQPSEFRKILEALSLGKIQIDNAVWMTRFRVSHRMVKSFQKGRVFLAGDAAHIHSPAGGQGMNTGMQDALNLGFKLKSVFNGGSLNLLRHYEKERLPVARGVLRGTDFFSRGALLPENALSGFARREILPILAGTGWIQRRIVNAVSQVDIAHREIAGYE